jgi:peroxiredoxin
MQQDQLLNLPPDLPIPLDDGACDHLPGMAVPPIALLATDGSRIRLDLPDPAGAPRTVVFAYPRTGRPGEDPPGGLVAWDAIPGARGCTPQACAYRDHFEALTAAGARVFGLSTQDTDYQRELADRLHLPYLVLSDEGLELTRTLRLPTFQTEGLTLHKRHTLVIRDGRIEHVLYPVFPSDQDADHVLAWLAANPV